MKHRITLVLGALAIAVGMLVQAPAPAQAGLALTEASWGWQAKIHSTDPDDYAVECDVVWSGSMSGLSCDGYIDGGFASCSESSGTNHIHCQTGWVDINCIGENDKIFIDMDGDVNGPSAPSNSSSFFSFSNCEGDGGGPM